MYDPLFRPGHLLPMEVARECMICRGDVKSKLAYPEGSLVVNFTRDFYLQCLNRFCPNRHVRAPMPCFLQHRDYELREMSMKVDANEGLLVKERQVGPLTVFDPDWDNERYNPSLQLGPHKDCPGTLDWDPDIRAQVDTWLLCGRCKARYHSVLLVTRGIVPLGYEASVYHQQFVWQVNRETGKPEKVIPASGRGQSAFGRIRDDVLMIIDQCVWRNKDVTITAAE